MQWQSIQMSQNRVLKRIAGAPPQVEQLSYRKENSPTIKQKLAERIVTSSSQDKNSFQTSKRIVQSQSKSRSRVSKEVYQKHIIASSNQVYSDKDSKEVTIKSEYGTKPLASIQRPKSTTASYN